MGKITVMSGKPRPLSSFTMLKSKVSDSLCQSELVNSLVCETLSPLAFVYGDEGEADWKLQPLNSKEVAWHCRKTSSHLLPFPPGGSNMRESSYNSLHSILSALLTKWQTNATVVSDVISRSLPEPSWISKADFYWI